MATPQANGTVLLPRADKAGSKGREVRPGITDLRGKRVAFIDDSRPNANVLLAEYQSLLEKQYGISSVVIHKVELGLRINEALPKDVFDKLAGEVDAGVVALGS